jgi:hypothetical protein
MRKKPIIYGKMNADIEHAKTKKDDGYFSAYANFATTLRNWLIIFGIGVPAYFAKEEKFAAKMLESGLSKEILTLFFLGIFFQLFEVFIYKVIMGYLYQAEENPSFKHTCRYKFSLVCSEKTWPIVCLDGGTVVLYGIATWKLLAAFTGE